MTTDIKDSCAHFDCCADVDGCANGDSCVGVNDCDSVDIGAIIGACLVDSMRTSRASFHSSTAILF